MFIEVYYVRGLPSFRKRFPPFEENVPQSLTFEREKLTRIPVQISQNNCGIINLNNEINLPIYRD